MLAIHNITVDSRLFNVSMSIPRGRLFGVVGPNGAGKSTLLKAITGLIPLDTGTIQYDSQILADIDRLTLSRLIHMVPQTVTIPFDYLAGDIVAMGCFDGKSCVDQALHTVDAIHLATRPVTQLSMGERQRIYLARALVTQCPVLLFDEPTANLDIRHQLEIWELLKKLTHENKTVIVTSHDLQMTTRYCAQVALMNQGQCHATGKTEDVLTQEEVEAIFGIPTLIV